MKVDVVFGIEIDGVKMMLDEDAARSLFYKLKEFFDRNNIYYIPYYPVTTWPAQPLVQPYISWTSNGSSIPCNASWSGTSVCSGVLAPTISMITL